MSEDERNIWKEKWDRLQDSLDKSCDRFNRRHKLYLSLVSGMLALSITSLFSKDYNQAAIVTLIMGVVIISLWLIIIKKHQRDVNKKIEILVDIELMIFSNQKLATEVKNGISNNYNHFRDANLEQYLPLLIMGANMALIAYYILLQTQ